ncbi:phospholipase A2-like isoform X2 [Chelonus insularis]|nr:phospholipase A2-like isoform X2 [Chelonus insularis]
MSSSAAPVDDSDKPITVLDEIETMPSADNNSTYTRTKRFFDLELFLARQGTNWCLDKTTDPDSRVSLGKFAQADKCCRTLVRCTSNEQDILTEKYPTKSRELRGETFRSCVCDDEFRRCLNDVVVITFPANSIGKYYFNHLSRTCRNDVLDLENNRAY